MASLRPVKRSVWDEVDDYENSDHNDSSQGEFVLPYRELSMTQKANLRQAKKFCEGLTAQWREWSGANKQQEIVQQQQQAQLHQLMQAQELTQRQKAYSVMCRVYIGSISFEMHESQVKEAFLPFGPIKSLDMSWDSVTMKHKGFCFIEYVVPEAAQLALDQMNGVLLGGRNIKVGRPSSVPAAAPMITRLNQEAEGFNRVYASGISSMLREADVRSSFERCGPVRSIQLAPGGRQLHGGFGYIEFTSPRAVEVAVTRMNLTEIGGSYLRVGKALTPPVALNIPAMAHTVSSAPPSSAQSAAGPLPAGVGNFLSKLQAANAVAVNHAQEQSIHHEEAIHISGGSARLMLMQKLQRKDESNVVVLRNMVSPSDVDSELPGEVKDECSRFGTVQQVIIHEQQEGMQAVIKIFVQFMLAHEAQKAMKGLHGRFFAGKTVTAQVYNREKFDKNDLSA